MWDLFGLKWNLTFLFSERYPEKVFFLFEMTICEKKKP